MEKSAQMLKKLYNIFEPLPSERLNEYYVPLKPLLEQTDFSVEEYIIRKIMLSEASCYQLLTGHKGSGKTTALLSLKEKLEAENYFVVYCPMSKYINLHDFYYVDFLLAILKCLSESLIQKDIYLNYTTLGSVNLSELKEMIPFKAIEFNLKFSMVSDYIRYSDFLRQKVRHIFDAQAINFINSFKEIFSQARIKLSDLDYKDIVILIDDLDIVMETGEEKENTLDTLLINYSRFIRELNAKVVLTLPVDRIFLEKEFLYKNIWGDDIHYYCPPGTNHKEREGLLDNLMRKIVKKRVTLVEGLQGEAFSQEALDIAISHSGGNAGQLLKILQQACLFAEDLPLNNDMVKRAIAFMAGELTCGLSATSLKLLRSFERELSEEASFLVRCNYIFCFPSEEGLKGVLNPLLKDVRNKIDH